ncbi:MAG: hypothetical protein F9K25_20455 [Candidatus Contendobacter sp.]|nr:MAG: hypothetical protein F9K25_20455 [Candidatus Contendobacter sp.]
MPSEPSVAVLRRKAFVLAGQLVGKGEPAYQLLHDLTGMTSISGQPASFWGGLVDQLRSIEHRKDREAPGCTVRQWDYIQALRQQLGMDEAHWRNFLKKQLKIDHQRFLTVSKARGAIAALTRMKAARGTQCESTQL